MPTLRFKRHYRAETLPPDMVFLLSESIHHTLTGKLYTVLAPLLDGRYDAAGIIASLEGLVPADKVEYALNRLLNGGYIIEDEDDMPPAQAAYWDMLNTPAPNAAVSVHTLGVEGLGAFTAIMASMKIPVTWSDGALDVVFTNDYLNPDLYAFNQAALESGRAWLLVKPVGAFLWVGPLFEPGASACWQCLAQRLRGNRALERFLEDRKSLDTPIALSRAALPSTMMMGLSLAATEAARWLATGTSSLRDTLVTFDTLALKTTHHAVVQRPQCPACGSATSLPFTPITLASRPKAPEADGGFRSTSASETFERYKHHVSPITGAVSRLDRVSSTELIHIYAAGPNKSRPFSQWETMRRSIRSNAAGKGIEDVQAKVSGMCEALERYSGVFDGSEPRRRGNYRQLADEAVHPATYLLFSEAQYRDRDAWNAACPPHLEVPLPFDERRKIEWTPVWSLGEQRVKYLPMSYCYYDYSDDEDAYFCLPDSNGNAAGSSLEDAILQGFMEVVERDAISIWWDNAAARPSFDLASIDHPYVRKVEAYHATINREVWTLDITTDLGIPVCVALSRRVDQPQQDIIMGFGAHFDARVAVLRAVTELNQMLPSVMSANRPYNSEARWEIEWWQNATVENAPFVAPHPRQPARRVSDYPPLGTTDLRDDVLACLAAVQARGMDMLVLDQTRPDIGLPVVKVVVPGMRHFWRRYAPGRLYDVPVSLGWQDSPTPEPALNPWAMFM